MIPINTSDGLFVDGDGANIFGTIVTAKVMNDMYAELANIWKAAGIETADQSNQAASAIQQLINTAIENVTKNVRTYQPGDFVATFAKVPPKGTLVCNGGAISRVDYADLFNVVGVQYGVGDDSTTFNLPNITENLALLAAGANLDAIGKIITGEIKSHTHSGGTSWAADHVHAYYGPLTGGSPGNYNSGSNNGWGNTNPAGGHNHTLTINATGGTNNIAAGIKLLFCIAY